MARTRYGRDGGLAVRMLGTMFGLGLLYVVVAVVLIWVGLSAPFVLLIAGGMLFSQWWFSDSLALASMRAAIVTTEQAPQLHGIVDRLCALADMPKPRVAIADSDIPNAFATGRSEKRAVVCVTTGLLRRLDPQEVEAVLAHELAHVAHKDMLVMTIASFAGVVAGLLTRMTLWGGMGRRRDDGNAALLFLAVLVVSVVVYAVSFLLTRMLSRYRELAADRGGAMVTGQPEVLARALTKVSGDMAAIPDRDLREVESVSAFFFAPALMKGASLTHLFSTHPPLEKRLEQLARISTELGRR